MQNAKKRNWSRKACTILKQNGKKNGLNRVGYEKVCAPSLGGKVLPANKEWGESI